MVPDKLFVWNRDLRSQTKKEMCTMSCTPVLIPTLNRQDHLQQCVESLLENVDDVIAVIKEKGHIA